MSKLGYLLVPLFLASPFSLKGQDFFISQAEYHKETDEISTTIRVKQAHKDGFGLYEILAEETDSLISSGEGEGYKRTRLNSSAFYFLDTAGYSNLHFFNEQHQFLGKASFVRFEHQTGFIDARVRAVFRFTSGNDKRRNSIKSRWNYLVTGNSDMEFIEGFNSSTEQSEKNLPNWLRSLLNINRTDVHKSNVISWEKNQKLYFISYGDYRDREYMSYIISESVSKPLNEEKSEFVVLQARALPILNHGYPVLLCRKAKPDTDWEWFEVMYYNGNFFVTAKGGILPSDSHK